jgi:hypothetical protein
MQDYDTNVCLSLISIFSNDESVQILENSNEIEKNKIVLRDVAPCSLLDLTNALMMEL